MVKLRFVTTMVPLAAIFTALSLSASAQQPSGNQQHGKPPPQKAAPVQRGPATGARPGYQQAVRPGPQQGVRPATGGTGYAARPATGGAGYAGRPAYTGRPAYASHPAFARHPGFARRDYGGHFYRGSLAWEGGRWRHEWRNGRYGWWWDVGGAWYFYDQPMQGPPAFVSEVEVLDDPALADAPPVEEVAEPVEAYPPPAPVVVAPAPVVVVPPPVVCVGPLCVR
jgi:hypothetical protein